VKAKGGRTTTSGTRSGGMSSQTIPTARTKTVKHHGELGGHRESKAIEELVPMRWRTRNRRGTGVVGGRSRCRAA